MSAKDAQRMWQLAARYSAVGIEMVAAVGMGTLAGWYGDEKFGTKPYLLTFGMLVGIGAAVKAVVRVIRDFRRGAF